MSQPTNQHVSMALFVRPHPWVNPPPLLSSRIVRLLGLYLSNICLIAEYYMSTCAQLYRYIVNYLTVLNPFTFVRHDSRVVSSSVSQSLLTSPETNIIQRPVHLWSSASLEHIVAAIAIVRHSTVGILGQHCIHRLRQYSCCCARQPLH